MSIRDNFGKPKYGSETFFKVWKQADGDNIYRILPPLKGGIKSGTWKIYLGQHWGYRVPSKKEKGKTSIRTFMCIEKKNRSGMVIQECPECVLIASKVEAKKEIQKKATAQGVKEEDIKELTVAIDKWLKEHNLERKWFVNAKNQKDEFGAFAFPHKANLNMEETFKELREKHKIDPIDIDQGVWLNFRRSGDGAAALHPVSAITESVSVQGRTFEAPKLAPLSDADLENAIAQCPDLESETMTILTYEQVKMLTESSGDPEEIESIFSLSQRTEKSPTPTPASKKEEPRVEVKVVETPKEEKKVDNVQLEEQLKATIAANKKASEEKKTTNESVPAVKTLSELPVNTDSMSDDEFYRLYSGKQ